MKLAESIDVLTKLGTTPNQDSTPLANASLEQATTVLENILNTPLDRITVADYFDFLPSVYDNVFTELQLLAKRGFWDVEEDIEVYVSTTGQALPADLSTLTPLDTKYYTYDPEQGSVFLAYMPERGRQTVAVKYTAGYTEGALDSVPEWLRNAAIACAVQNYGLHNIGFMKKDFRDKSTEQTRFAYSLVSNRIRTRLGSTPSISRKLA